MEVAPVASGTGADERGRLLLAVMVRSMPWMICLWALIAAAVAFVVMDSLKRRQLRLGGFLGIVPGVLVYALFPRVRFYDGGVTIPPSRDDSRPRFLRWSQIARYSWDGDRLVLTGTTAVLEGGPVQGAIVPIPPSRKLEVEQMLLLKLGL